MNHEHTEIDEEDFYNYQKEQNQRLWDMGIREEDFIKDTHLYAITIVQNKGEPKSITEAHYKYPIKQIELYGIKCGEVRYELKKCGRLHVHILGESDKLIKCNRLIYTLTKRGYNTKIDNVYDESGWLQYIRKNVIIVNQ